MDQTELKKTLQRIVLILQGHQSERLQLAQQLLTLCDADVETLYRELNTRHVWGGAESLANEALADNPGIEEWQWQVEIQEFRELMIELGQHLISRGKSYPDISSWLLAFNNWNQSEY